MLLSFPTPVLLLSGLCTTCTAAQLGLCTVITSCTRGGRDGHLGPVHKAAAGGAVMMLFTLAHSSFSLFSVHKQLFHLHSRPRSRSGGGGGGGSIKIPGAAAAGDMPEDVLLKHVFTTKSRLGSGGQSRPYLSESLRSVCCCSLLSVDKNTTQTGRCGSPQTLQRLRLNGRRSSSCLTLRMWTDSSRHLPARSSPLGTRTHSKGDRKDS